jgi:peptidoglycan-associated lipoprotein
MAETVLNRGDNHTQGEPQMISKKLLVFMIASTLAAAACSSKKPTTDNDNLPSAANADANTMGDSDHGSAMGLQTIHFGYDAYVIDTENKAILKANAEILKEKTSVKIQIEGNCDQRGGLEYNVALGEKRANSAKKYLQDLGISADRITIISFGKEKPIDNGTSEEAYAKNRRGNFVITSH